MKIVFRTFLILLFTVLVSCSGKGKSTAVISVNSLNGNIFPLSSGSGITGGFSLISGKVNEIRYKYSGNAVLIANSNFIYGTEAAYFTRGQAVIDIMNRIGFSCMVIGHREFYFGQDRLKELSSQAKFPFISVNILSSDSTRPGFIKPYMLTDDGKTAVIGFSTHKVIKANLEKDVEGIIISDPVKAVRDAVAELKKKNVENIILAGDFNCDSDLSSNLTETEINGLINISDIDIIFSTSVNEDDCEYASNEKYISSALKGTELALTVFSGGRIIKKEVIKIDSKTASPDKTLSAHMADIDQMIKSITGKAIGTSQDDIAHLQGSVFDRESDLGNFISDIIREYTGSDIFLMNSGKVRAGIKKGTVTLGDLYKIMPYEGTVVTVEMTGAQIFDILESSCSLKMSKSFLQVSGITFSYDRSAEKMHRVIKKSVKVNGSPIDMKRLYSVSLTQYIFGGGDSYSEFGEMDIKKVKIHQKQMREIIRDHIIENSPVSIASDNRIREVSAEK